MRKLETFCNRKQNWRTKQSVSENKFVKGVTQLNSILTRPSSATNEFRIKRILKFYNRPKKFCESIPRIVITKYHNLFVEEFMDSVIWLEGFYYCLMDQSQTINIE